MVVPLIIGGLLRASPIIARFLPKIARGVSKTFLGVAKKPIRSLLKTSFFTGLVGLGISSPTLTKKIIFSPITAFKKTREIGTKIEAKLSPQDPMSRPFGKSTPLIKPDGIGLGEGLIGAGAVGLTAAALLKILEKREPKIKEKVLLPSDVVKAQPSEDIGKMVAQEETIGAVPKPKAPTKEKPLSIKNTFNPEINISFSKRRSFINQQILIK